MSTLTGRTRRAALRSVRVIGFALYFGREFLVSNLVVLREILALRGRATPAVIEVRLRSRSTLEVVSLANLLTLTPGTLVLELATDPPTLYVHGMFAADPDAFVAQIHALEDRMLAALRPVDRYRAGAGGGPEVSR
jgi:multicomponent Na+:H+ antiporter subunit E